MSIFNLRAVGSIPVGGKPVDVTQVRRSLEIFLDPEQHVYLYARPSNDFQCFSALAMTPIIEWIENHRDSTGVYLTVNPCNYISQKLRVGDIAYRRWLMVSVERNKMLQPENPATEAEHSATMELAFEIMSDLEGMGFPAPVRVDLANGHALYYRIDLPNDTEHRDLIHDFLKLLDSTFSDTRGTVDHETFAANATTKIPGTWSQKGAASKERPFRQINLLYSPKQEILPVALLRKIVAGEMPLRPQHARVKAPLSVQEIAVKLVGAGYSIVPIIANINKAEAFDYKKPDTVVCPSWKHLEKRLPTKDELDLWFCGARLVGVATIAGMVSGNLEIIDIDREDIFDPWADAVESLAPGLIGKLHTTKTPGGYHLRYRCPEVTIPGNSVLAKTNEKFQRHGKESEVLIETRGEGGYALISGCPPECHLAGTDYYDMGQPLWESSPVITAEEREILFRVSRSFDRKSQPAAFAGLVATGGNQNGDLRPGDDYNQRGPRWEDILSGHGWKIFKQYQGGAIHWTRPGKDHGTSATTGHCRSERSGELFYVFTSNASPFEAGKAYSKFSVLTLLEHNGDFGDAARSLSEKGFGDQASIFNQKAKGTVVDPRSAADMHAIYTLPELLSMEIAEPKWAVPGILSQGLTLLAGAPKQGKSWLALNLGITIAAGGMALGNIKVVPGDVLYLSLEDRLRRVQFRVKKILGGIGCEASKRLKVAVAWPRMHEGGMDKIKEWAQTCERPTLVIIDVWQKFKPISMGKKGNQYEEDYQHSTVLKDFVDSIDCSAMAIHHTKKGKSEDWLEDVSGTLGLGGAADGVLVLQRSRGSTDAKLCMTGRDIDEKEMALTFEPEHAVWTCEGTSKEREQGKIRTSIFDFLKARPGQHFASKDIFANIEGKNPGLILDTVSRTLSRMVGDFQIAKKGHTYTYPVETGDQHDEPVGF